MPRVHMRTRQRAEVKHPMRCNAYPCKVAEQRDGDNEIRKGDQYYTWEKRYGGPQYRHVACGRPTATQLSNRKTAVIEEAVDQFTTDFTPQVDEQGEYDGDYSDVTSQLEDIAAVAREVGEEYQASYDNIPEGLNQGYTAEAMQQVAEELDSWAGDLESFSPNDWEQPEREDGESDEDYAQRAQDELDTWASEVTDEAESMLGDMPEYQG